VFGEVVGVPGSTVASVAPDAAVTVLFAGQEIVGALPAGTTVTVKLQLPPPSEEEESTVVVPIGKKCGALILFEISPHSPIPSAEGSTFTFAPPGALLSTVMSPGQVSTQVVPPPLAASRRMEACDELFAG
jgi:hypothetical protein